MRQVSQKKRILVVEGDEILSGFLDKYLSKNNYEPVCIPNGDDIQAALEKHRFDVVVLDFMLAGRSGLYWLKWIKQYHSYLSVVVISSRTGEDDRLSGLRAGAQDYVIKPFHAAELLIRIENILRGSPRYSSRQGTVQAGHVTLELGKNRAFRGGEEVKLTMIEVNILKLLYINAGATLSRDDISEQIRGAKHHPLDRSIDIHINKLRKKIEEDPSNPLLIRTIRGKGYSFQVPETKSESETEALSSVSLVIPE